MFPDISLGQRNFVLQTWHISTRICTSTDIRLQGVQVPYVEK